jgi:E3 ubiquitin-protein ligase SHPRH
VLQVALKRFGIVAASIHEAGGAGIERFRREAGVEAFLLDAKSNSSGLNLVNATHVFLCEPLVNPAVELQAIARVHRIGQLRPTTVWMILVRDSVEGGVYDMSAARRLAHVKARRAEAGGADADVDMDASNSLELQGAPLARLLARSGGGKAKAAAQSGGGEIVARDDLFACLFNGRARNGAGDGAAMASATATAANGVLGGEVRRYLAGEAAEARRESE